MNDDDIAEVTQDNGINNNIQPGGIYVGNTLSISCIVRIMQLIPEISVDIIVRIMNVARCHCAMVQRNSIGKVEMLQSLRKAVMHWVPNTSKDIANKVAEIAALEYKIDLRDVKPPALFEQRKWTCITLNQTIISKAVEYLQKHLNSSDSIPEPEKIEEDLLIAYKIAFDIANAVRPKREKWPVPKTLPRECIALCLIASGYVSCIEMEDGKYRVAFYHTDGKYKGLWRVVTDLENEYWGNKLIRRYNLKLKIAEFAEVYQYLKDEAPVRQVTQDPMVTAVKNGVYFHDTGMLLDYEECRGLTMLNKI